MGDPITWYLLGRTVDDTESILEAVDAKMLTHNQDASAHGQSSESLYNHRIAELLDHVHYSIYNMKVSPAARIYKAIVGAGLTGDFSTIQAAIDWANLYGGGTVFIKAGTYILSSNLTLYSNITLLGEDNDSVILDFNEGNYGIEAVGTSGTHKKNIFVKNITVKNSQNYDQGAVYFSYVDDSGVEDCYFNDNREAIDWSTTDVHCDNCKRIHIERNRAYLSDGFYGGSDNTYIFVEENYIDQAQDDVFQMGNHTYLYIRKNLVLSPNIDASRNGVIFSESVFDDSVISENIFTNVKVTGIELTDSDRVVVCENYIEGGAGSGVGISLNGSYCTILDNRVENMSVDGIIAVGNYTTLTGNIVRNSTAKGIRLSGDYETVNGNISTSNDMGLEIDNGSDRDTIVGNYLRGNSSGSYSNNGSNAIIEHNQT